MKKITLKKEKIDVTTVDGVIEADFDYRVEMLNALNVIPPEGMTPKVMEDRLRVRNVVGESDNELLIEDTDYNILRNCINDVKWNVIDEKVTEYVKAVNDAVDVKIKEVE